MLKSYTKKIEDGFAVYCTICDSSHVVLKKLIMKASYTCTMCRQSNQCRDIPENNLAGTDNELDWLD